MASAGGLGFRGSKKFTPYAGTEMVRCDRRAALIHGPEDRVDAFARPGSGREAAIRRPLRNGLMGSGDPRGRDTVPHNGCRPSKTQKSFLIREVIHRKWQLTEFRVLKRCRSLILIRFI